ncbi:MAG: RsiV family protein [Thermanaerothrix sp.]|nr:RsiV family protein [Thermanaerothrix sp.]
MINLLYLNKTNQSRPCLKNPTGLALMAALALLMMVQGPAESAPRASMVTIRREVKGFPITVRYARVESGSPGAAKLSINRALRQDALSAMAHMVQIFSSSEAKSNPDRSSFYGERRAEVAFLKGNLISVKNVGFVSAPMMAHPVTSFSAATYDLYTGERVALGRLFKEGWEKRIEEAVNAMAKERISKDQLALNEGQDLPKGDDYSYSFYLDLKSKSLVIFWERYRFTPGVYGDVEFKIPLKDLQDIAREPAIRIR